MACKCKDCKTYYRTVCKVCEIVDGDSKIKPTCYCEFCKAHMCKDCFNNGTRRAQAFIEEKIIEPIAKLFGKKSKVTEETPTNEQKEISSPDTEDNT